MRGTSGWALARARRVAAHMADAVAASRPEAADKPPWERTVLDDIAARRPWNLRVKAARRLALRRIESLDTGVTVVVVNWNTRDVTADVISAVREFSPPATRILLVDNGSTDGSREHFKEWPGIETLFLRSNAGHGVALDLALCAVRTTVAVTLDSDAIPLTDHWLDAAVDPIRDGRAVLAGLRSSRNFVHPVYSAVNTAEFLRRRLSFQPFIPPGVVGATAQWGVNAWDTSELMIRRLHPSEICYVERTENAATGLPGMTTGGVVYHHGGVSRGANGAVEADALSAWRDACVRLRTAMGQSGKTS